MIVRLNWASMKSIIDLNETNFFYSTEDEFVSNKPDITNIKRYFIRQAVGLDENHSFISKDGGNDQDEFDNDYKTQARAIEAL